MLMERCPVTTPLVSGGQATKPPAPPSNRDDMKDPLRQRARSPRQSARQNVAAVYALYPFLCWLVLGLFGLAAATHAERRVALVIGNSAYAESSLRNPVNDAHDMRERLLTLGFDQANIVYREDLKTAQIGDLLREWRRKLEAGPDTVALVFYAGHGLQIRGENFLPTVDARIEGEEDVPQQALKLADLMSVMAESKTRMNLVLLDACRNNPYARGFRDATRGLAPERLPTGTLIAYATRPGSVAADGRGRNGVFTSHLLANLSSAGVPVELMLKQVSDDVYIATEGKQEPWQEGSIRGFFYFATARPQAAPAPVPAPAPMASRPQSGRTIKDCDICPELVVLPRGSFMMGSAPTEPERAADEGPIHRVTIDYDLAVGKFEVTQGQWQAVMGSNPSRFKDCGANCPVEKVSWNDAQEYLKKLSARTGQRYRLLSEAEWEYAARAGTTTPFHTGETITTQQANFNGNHSYNGSAKGIYRVKTVAVGSFAPNAFGLHDMHGNVREWVLDMHRENYIGAPSDGSSREGGGDGLRPVLRGGCWSDGPMRLRSAFRVKGTPAERTDHSGLRVARTS